MRTQIQLNIVSDKTLYPVDGMPRVLMTVTITKKRIFRSDITVKVSITVPGIKNLMFAMVDQYEATPKIHKKFRRCSWILFAKKNSKKYKINILASYQN